MKKPIKTKGIKGIYATEAQEQRALIRWWGLFARQHYYDERLLFAVPNGAHLAGDARARAIKMSNLKAQGLRVGVPDLMLAINTTNTGKNSAGLFLEMKRRKGGRSTQAQAEMRDLLCAQGYSCVMCCGWEEAQTAIKNYLGVFW